jgi:hypothetical protein
LSAVVSAMGNKLPLTDPSFAPFYDYCVQVGMPAMFMVGYTGVGAGTWGDGIVSNSITRNTSMRSPRRTRSDHHRRAPGGHGERNDAPRTRPMCMPSFPRYHKSA